MAVAQLDSVADVRNALGTHGYLADDGLATAVFLALSLKRPLLLEGEAGVGKTELAKVIASMTGAELIRLQCYEGIDATDIDRVVLDLPEPWQVVPHAQRVMRPGGILVAYTPSITQAAQTREALANPSWTGTRTLEVLHRGWYIEGMAVRPDHRMVAHTGFLTVGRLLGE